MGYSYSTILNPRSVGWKFKPSYLIVYVGPGESSSSAKSCYNNKGVVTHECLNKLLAENDIQLFDVRTRQEAAAGKIPGATNIPRKS